MTDASERTRNALRAAHLYYVEDRKMDAIAQQLHVSRSSVSRLISYARQSGLVDIRIKAPSDGIAKLQWQLKLAYGVNAHIIPCPDSLNSLERLERVGRYAGKLVNHFVHPGMTIGIAWGATMSAVGRHVHLRPVADLTVVQLNGAAYTESSGIGYAAELLERFAGAFSARIEHFPVPAFFDDPLTREAMWRERSIRRIREMQARMDVAFFSVGDPLSSVPGHLYRGAYLSEDDSAELAREGVVGDVATMFYRGDGSSDGIRLNRRSSGPTFDSLRGTPRRVCIVADPSKEASLRGALNARLVTDLIVDETTARALDPDDAVWALTREDPSPRRG